MTRDTLALDGGTPVRSAPFPPWPRIEEDEIAAVQAVLRSGRVNYWTGEEGRKFEEEFARFTGCSHAVATSNGTVALEAALQALGIGAGDEVVVPCRTFIATASAVVMRGAVPVVADVDRDSQNLTVETVRAVVTPRTRAVIPVHLAGWPCDMDPLLELARERGLKVVEDCAQALGATYKGRSVGSFGDAAAFSFCQDKIMTTLGEGGMLTTNDRALWERAWSYKDHGKSTEALRPAEGPPGFRWIVERFGTNGRMTEVQAAAGRVALRKVPAWVARRRALSDRLNDRLARVPGLQVAVPGNGVEHSRYKYFVRVEPAALKEGWSRDRVLEAVAAEGIPAGTGFCPEIYREKAFDGFPRPAARLAGARELGETTLMVPVHPTLEDGDVDDVARALEKVMTAARR